MDLMSYIDKGGAIVYILIALNIIGFTIILWKFFTLPRKNAIISNISAEQNQSAREGCSGSSGFPKGRCTNCCAAALFDAKPCKRGAAGYIIQIDTV